MTRPRHIPKDGERYDGQAPFTSHRMDLLPYDRRKADRCAAASLIAGVCAIAGGVVLIIVTMSALLGGAL